MATQTRGTPRLAPPHAIPAIDVPVLAPAVVAACRPRAAALSRRITHRICAEVDGFSEPRLAATVARSTTEAIDLFVDAMAGAPVRGHTVAASFFQLGSEQARGGHDLNALRASLQIAMQEVWSEVQDTAQELELPGETRQQLASAAMAYQRFLHDQSVAGHHAEHDARGDLAHALVNGSPMSRIRQLAGPVWPLPDRIAVASTEVNDAARGAASAVTGALVTLQRRRLVVMAAPELVEQSAMAMARTSRRPVAICWPVAPDEVVNAVRWTRRILRLARQGDIPPSDTGVLRCCDHRLALWQHADPALSSHVITDLLAPLMGVTPGQREVLGETMLLWLQTHGSAPAMARQLGVHDQTVRHRLRTIRSLFGGALDDPEHAAEITQALHVLRGPSTR